MRVSRALAAAAACAAVGVSAPPAVAGGDSRDSGQVHVSVSPHAVHQGATLTITVHGCARGGTITSNAFPRIHLHRGDGGREDNREFGRDEGREDNREESRGEGGRGDNRGEGKGEGRSDNRGGDGGDANRNENRNENRNDNRGNTTSVGARIHDHATPGHYNLAVRCHNNSGNNNGNGGGNGGGNGNGNGGGNGGGHGQVATAHFVVLSGRGALGGVGGSMSPSSTETAIGAGLVATAAVGGALFLARRRRVVSGRA